MIDDFSLDDSFTDSRSAARIKASATHEEAEALFRTPIYRSYAVFGWSGVASFCFFLCLLSFYGRENAPAADLPAPACFIPTVRQEDAKRFVLPTTGIAVTLPGRWTGQILEMGRMSFTSNNGDDIDFEVRSTEQDLERCLVKRQSDYKHYTECRVTIGGHEAIIQSFRGGGELIIGKKSVETYHAGVALQICPGQVLTVSGQAVDRQVQEEILAILRTIEFANSCP